MCDVCAVQASLVAVIVLGLGAAGCATATDGAGDCRAGTPRSVFREDLPGVTRHSFERHGQRSSEAVQFATREALFLQQEGCDTLRQTLELPVPDTVDTWPKFKALASRRFDRYTEIDESLLAFAGYARALRAVPDDYPVAQPAPMAPGLTMRVYEVPNADFRTWQIVLEQDLSSGAPVQ